MLPSTQTSKKLKTTNGTNVFRVCQIDAQRPVYNFTLVAGPRYIIISVIPVPYAAYLRHLALFSAPVMHNTRYDISAFRRSEYTK